METNVEGRQKKPEEKTRKRQSDKTSLALIREWKRGEKRRKKKKRKRRGGRKRLSDKTNLALIGALALLPHGWKGASGAEALGPIKVALCQCQPVSNETQSKGKRDLLGSKRDLRVLPPWPSLHISQFLDNTRMPNLPSPYHPAARGAHQIVNVAYTLSMTPHTHADRQTHTHTQRHRDTQPRSRLYLDNQQQPAAPKR